MPIERSDWVGLLGHRTDVSRLVVEVPLQASPAGGSGTFLAQLSDRRRWWVKPQNNLQGPKVIVTEHIVARAGRLIGAPVCEVAVVEIPEEVAGWEFRQGSRLEPGLAHASLAVEDAQEARTLEYVDRDDNRRRHAGIFALYDWCWGGDDQWLYSESADRAVFSHDHGWYLPDNGPDWTETTLLARVDEAHPAHHPHDGLAHDEIERLAARLETVTRDEVADLLRGVPAEWPVLQDELEAIGFFLERRASEVARRIRNLMGGGA